MVNHVLLIDILHKYGAPPKFTTAIETIYQNNMCILKIENEVAEIPQTVGVGQGDNMAPMLFLFLMTAFAETLELVWKNENIPILSVMTAADEHFAEGRICSHTPAMVRSTKLTAYSILQCLYVNDGACPFGTRDDLQRGVELIYHHFARFGLEMHIGRGTAESKTECVFFPPPQFFQRLERNIEPASLIQRAFRRARHTRSVVVELDTQPAHPVSNALIFLPGHFPIGSHVTVVPSHPQHGNATGIVTRHTAKFVTFSPDASPDSRIRILPNSLLFLPSPTPSPPKHHDRGASHGRVVLREADDDQARTGRQR